MSDEDRPRDAVAKYLEQWAEPLVRQVRWPENALWTHVLVVPLFDEDASWLEAIPTRREVPEARILVIAVVNAPADAPVVAKERTQRLLETLTRGESLRLAPSLRLTSQANGIDLLLCDRCSQGRQFGTGGVGLARKLGCDLALAAMSRGLLATQWIATSDGDVQSYLAHIEAQSFLTRENCEGAAILPFHHVSPEHDSLGLAHELYELSLWHYVLGLAEAGSPYAFHTIGSTLLFHYRSYAQVRGFPKRKAGEDFHVLCKVRKVGSVQTLAGRAVPIRGRTSRRVPFGTGAAVSHLLTAEDARRAKLFFDPAAFKTLRNLLDIFSSDGFSSSEVPFDEALGPLADNVALVMQLQRWDASTARERLISQCGSRAQFRKQWHAWFDGLKTLQMVRALTSDSDTKLSLTAAARLDAWLGSGLSVSALLENARKRWAKGEFDRLGTKPLEQVGRP